ncbi:alpha/beta fold hydrolase [Streptomyces macrosporus]|uniref:2Fe-2S ferredoxin-type domain-containing protein n=1 Tax=Streptomyces macrosporus TaxID=44032 RepID=A0ABP5XDM4_9ACTN
MRAPPAATARRMAGACAENGGPVLRTISTANEARDIDRVRRALGEARISVWGVSYGAYVGAVHARMFPHRTDRVVLDSSGDPDPKRVARGRLANHTGREARWRPAAPRASLPVRVPHGRPRKPAPPKERTPMSPPARRTEDDERPLGASRRRFLSGSAAAGVAAGSLLHGAPPVAADPAADGAAGAAHPVEVEFTLNGERRSLTVDPRTTLLDALRERLGTTGPKKGCDRGQCGACTVHENGRPVLACLTLAATVRGKEITTVEGLAERDELHPVQEAFIDCDAFQCGFCTPGQIMSAAALVDSGRRVTDDRIREYMSGNLCRCGAYPNIVDAVRRAQERGGRRG